MGPRSAVFTIILCSCGTHRLKNYIAWALQQWNRHATIPECKLPQFNAIQRHQQVVTILPQLLSMHIRHLSGPPTSYMCMGCWSNTASVCYQHNINLLPSLIPTQHSSAAHPLTRPSSIAVDSSSCQRNMVSTCRNSIHVVQPNLTAIPTLVANW